MAFSPFAWSTIATPTFDPILPSLSKREPRQGFIRLLYFRELFNHQLFNKDGRELSELIVRICGQGLVKTFEKRLTRVGLISYDSVYYN